MLRMEAGLFHADLQIDGQTKSKVGFRRFAKAPKMIRILY